MLPIQKIFVKLHDTAVNYWRRGYFLGFYHGTYGAKEILMLNKNKSEKGQAIIFIVFAIVGLLGITALAIDGSAAFSDRRHAQSAADNAALAAAQALAHAPNNPPIIQTAGLALASSNGYTSDVQISMTNATSTMSPDCKGNILITPSEIADHENYILVVIRSVTNTYFGPIIGINQVHNCVEAVAKATIFDPLPYVYGNAIAALSCDDSRAIDASGSSTTITYNGGVFSNSTATDAFYALKNEGIQVDPGFGGTSVGGFDLGFPTPAEWHENQLGQQIPCPVPENWYHDDYECTYNYVNFPDSSLPETTDPVTGRKYYDLAAGTYCISGDFNWQSNTDIRGNDVHFVIETGTLFWKGNAGFYLKAGTDGPLAGILIYLPEGNSSDVTINGTAGSEITGTIFAVNSTIKINGDYTGTAWTAQILGHTVDLSGSSNLSIFYDSSQLATYTPDSILGLDK